MAYTAVAIMVLLRIVGMMCDVAGIAVKAGHPFGGLSVANVTIFLCKASEVLSMQDATLKEKGKFVASTAVAQGLGYVHFVGIMMLTRTGIV